MAFPVPPSVIPLKVGNALSHFQLVVLTPQSSILIDRFSRLVKRGELGMKENVEKGTKSKLVARYTCTRIYIFCSVLFCSSSSVLSFCHFRCFPPFGSLSSVALRSFYPFLSIRFVFLTHSRTHAHTHIHTYTYTHAHTHFLVSPHLPLARRTNSSQSVLFSIHYIIFSNLNILLRAALCCVRFVSRVANAVARRKFDSIFLRTVGSILAFRH